MKLNFFQLYGGNCSTKMLSAFGKLFQTHLLQTGFTLGVKDIFLTAKADKKRKKIMKECRKVSLKKRKKIILYFIYLKIVIFFFFPL